MASDALALFQGDPAAKLDAVYHRLVAMYGLPEWRPDGDALGGLIGTILSQNTSDVNSGRAYQQLIATFPSWEAVRDAPVEAVAEAIRPGGLANVKAPRIQQVLRVLTERLGGGPLTLAVLDDMPLDDALAYLRALPGVGPKTAACVLLFNLGRPAFPVDTHVWRVSRRLGLIGPRVSPDEAHDVLGRAIAPERRYTMHVHLIHHGRRICHAQRPECPHCGLRALCDQYGQFVAQEP